MKIILPEKSELLEMTRYNPKDERCRLYGLETDFTETTQRFRLFGLTQTEVRKMGRIMGRLFKPNRQAWKMLEQNLLDSDEKVDVHIVVPRVNKRRETFGRETPDGDIQ